jgi:hypothetical protein
MTSAPARQHVRAAAPPRAAAGASYLAVPTALVLGAVGVVAVRDTAVAAGWLSGQSWIYRAIAAVDGWTPTAWLQPLGIIAAFLGIGLVVIALKPRRVTAEPIGTDTGVFIGLGDIAKVATAAADDVAGVLDARSSATRRKVVIRCTVTGDTGGEIERRISDAASAALQPLRHTPRIIVRTRKETRT